MLKSGANAARLQEQLLVNRHFLRSRTVAANLATGFNYEPATLHVDAF